MSYKIKLEVFEGPLDLLLYLIKEEELNIYDIPITRITEQYLEYLNLMEMLDLDIAGEFLVMAATLMHIKSKLLLPPDPDTVETEELDPRAELVRRLLEYKAFKEAAGNLRGFESTRSEYFTRVDAKPEMDTTGDSPFVEVSLFDLLTAFAKVMKSTPQLQDHEVEKDEFSVSEKVHEIFHRLVQQPKIYFSELFKKARNKYEIITTFLAILELIRLKEVVARQSARFGEIEIERNIKEAEGAEA